jgi:predicted SAM-dependent methyltransferase
LKPFGTLYLSVPDLDTLARLFLNKDLLTLERFFVMRMIFGGHVNEQDFHLAGLNQEFLENYLQEAGFRLMRKVDEFRIFPDTSSMRFKDVLISLNMVARKLPC